MGKQLNAFAVTVAFMTSAPAGELDAYSGIAADAATTGAALSMPGVAEANPLGWMTLPIRVAIVEHAKTLARSEAQPILDAVSASSWGAAVNNILILTGATVAAPVIGILVGYAVWTQGETEREFWRLCAVHKQMQPQARCQYRV